MENKKYNIIYAEEYCDIKKLIAQIKDKPKRSKT